MKKIILFFVAVLLGVSNVFAGTEIDGLYYSLGPYGASVTYSSVTGESMYGIAVNVYNKYWNITTANIPSTVTYNGTTYTVLGIGDNAFNGCSSLTSITIPNISGLNSKPIGNNAFSQCNNLTSVTINSESVINGKGDYYHSSTSSNSLVNIFGAQVTDYIIGDDVQGIASSAFYNCANMRSVTIGNSVKSIGADAFYGCSGLTAITCEATTPPTLGSSVFESVNKSIPLYVPAESIDAYKAADQWQDFSNILPIPCILASGTCGAEGDNLTWKLSCDSVLTISGTGEMADYSSHTPWYSNIEAIVSVVIENGVTSIDGAAFSQCNNLKSIIIGNSVSDIGEYNPFAYCRNLSSIVVSSSNTTFDSRNGCNAIIEKSTNSLRVGSNSTIIPNDVINIGKGAFQGCESLTNIEIPNSVTSISEWAFYRCKGLTSVEIPNNVITIGEYAFSECYLNLTSVTIGDGVTSIGKSAFERCIDMSSVSIGSNVTNIGSCAFISCTSLSTITCKAATPPTCGSDVFYNVSKSIPLYVPAESVEAYRAADGWKEFTNIQAIPDTPKPEIVNPVKIGDLYYNLDADNLTAEVTYQEYQSSNNYSGLTSADIPSSVTYSDKTFSVTSIGWGAFEYCTGLTSIAIPSSVTSIGSIAFLGCSGLISITVAAGNTVYDSRNNCNAIIESATNKLFAGCKNTIIPSRVKSIEQYAFYNCSGLTSVTIPNSVTYIGISAFGGCSGLTSVTIPNSVTSIAYQAFADCTGLTSITIPNSVIVIGSAVFLGCSSLTTMSVAAGNPVYDSRENCNAIIETATNTLIAGCQNSVIPSSVTSIGSSAFGGCSSLTSITIPNSVTSIGHDAFSKCSGLTSVTIPSSVTSIGGSVFMDCTSLTSLTIPNSVTNIENYTFYNCSALTSLTCEATTPPTLGTGVFRKVDKSIPLYVPAESVDAYQATDGWKDFNVQAIPCILASGTCGAQGDNLTWELSCDSVLTISGTGEMANYTNISDQPWAEKRENIKSLVIEDGVTTLGIYAYYGCSNLTSVSIPSSVTRIIYDAFQGCNSLTKVNISDLAAWCKIIFFLESSNPLCYAKHLFLNDTEITELVIPNSVTSIGMYAFQGCSNLTSLTIPNSVTSIGQYAFAHCSSLTSVTIPNSVTSTGNGILFGCSSLTSVNIPNSITSIEYGTFYNCNNLTSVTIPNSVTSIGEAAFYGCSSLTSVTIPNSVTSIGNNAFHSCASLTSIIIPNNVTSIGYQVFWACNSLTSITCEAEYPPSLGSNAFALIDHSIPLYVPAESIDAYKAADQWNEFTNIQAIPCTLASGTCGAEGDNLTWELSCDSVLTISGTGDMAGYANMDQSWRDYTKSFKSVVIGDGVTSIGDSAFHRCTNLTSVTIPSGVTSIGRLALYDCPKLTSVTIPNTVTSIGYGTFVGCIGLTAMTVEAGNPVFDSRNNCNAIIETATNRLIVGCQNTVVPSSVTSIGDGAFRGCTTLTSINIPNGVTSIEPCAFWHCGLTSIDFPSSLTSIGRQAFVNCYELASVDIPNSVTSIGNGAFINCRSLTSIDIPNSITSIGDSTFYHCTGLTAVTIPSGVTSIGLRAFYQCSGMTSLTLSNSVTSMGVGVFCGCYSLTSMTVDAGNTVYDSRDNCNAIIETATNTLVVGCQNTVIPNTVTRIGNFAFRECSTLTSIDIPNSVTSIGNGVFYGCTGLTSVTIPSGVTSIEGWAFYGCSGLKSISCRATNVPESGSNIFTYVSKSIPLLVPAESIESYRAADQWKDFTNIYPICPNSGTCGAQGDNLTWELSCDSVLTISGTGAMANLGAIDPLLRAYMGNFRSVVIGDGVTSIGDSAFYNCSHLTSVTIPSGVTSIGARAFYKCHNLTSVTIPSSVTSIGIGAFCDGSGLTSMSVEAGNTVYDSRDNCNAIIETATNTLIVGCQNTVIPNSVTSIGDNAFRECSSLTSIDIPNSVTSIGNYAFRACAGLTSVTIGNGVTTIGKYAFYGCSGLTSVIIPYGVTSIGNGAFSSCNGLTSVILPNSVTSIGEGAFYDCSGLTSMTIPSTVTGIGQYAFGGCSGLTSLTCKATDVPELGSDVFYLVDKSIPLHVPAESVDAYKAADQWKDFTNIISTCLIASGTCGAQGDNLTWELSCDTVLTISGTGAMPDYNNSFYKPNLPPWYTEWHSSISSVVLSEGVTNVGNDAFWDCGKIASVTIPNTVTSIGNRSFQNCIMTAVTIPNSVTSIGSYAFADCSGLTNVIIPNSVDTIGSNAFRNCGSLTNVTMSDNITSISDGLFRDCKMLTSFDIPDGVTTIGSCAFYYCKNLKSITIPNSVTKIGGDAFYQCQQLKSVEVPDNVTSIGDEAFGGCCNITSIVIPYGVTVIKGHTFSACSRLASVSIPNTVTSIESNAFIFCDSLHNIVIPNRVTSIGIGVFTSSGLETITIPASVTSMGGSTLSNCNKLTSVIFEGITPPTFENTYATTIFNNTPCNFYVPCGTKEAYLTAFNNGVDADRIIDESRVFEKMPYSYSIISSNDDQGSVAITHEPVCSDLTLSFTAMPAQGYGFLQWSDGNTDNPRTLTLVQDTVITAQWVKIYAITWKNADGTTLATDVVRQGATPVAPADPTKAATAEYTYTFSGWTPDIVAATADATYTATYSATLNEYTVSGEQNISALAVGANTHIIVGNQGHLIVDVSTTIGCLTLTMNGTTAAQVTGIENLTASTIDAVLTVRARQWFAMGVPFDVNLATGIRINGANAAANYGTDYVMDEYDGALRASTQDGWKRVAASATLHPGKLYMIYTAGATTWRMTAANPAAVAEAQRVDVQAYVSSLNNRHSGWNGVANTLLSDAEASLIGVIYATLYNNQHSVYSVVPTVEKTFILAEPFFVQTPTGGSVLFAAADAAPAPWRVAAAEIPTMTVALTNEAQTFTDKAYISMAQDKPNTYLIGHDLEKMQVAAPAVPQLWLEAYDMHLAAYETSLMSDNQIIPLGMYAPAEGYYSIALDNAPADKSITLLRNDQPVWNLSESACVASLQAGNNADYALRISQKNDVVTDLNTLNGSSVEVRKLIIDDQLYILREGKTYTVQGWEMSNDKLRK